MYAVRAFVLFSLITLGIVFSIPFFLHADVGTPVRLYEQSSRSGAVITTGTTATRTGLKDPWTADDDYYIATTSFEITRYGAVTDYVYAFILSSDGNVVATSSNWVLGSTLGTSGYGTSTFSFDNYLVASGTTVYFGFNRSGAYNSSQRYQAWSASGAGSYYYTSNENPNKTMVQVIEGYTYIDPPSATCPEGYECYTIEEMATTTEAIYALGYSINLYMGIFLALVCGYMAFVFFKQFIP